MGLGTHDSLCVKVVLVARLMSIEIDKDRTDDLFHAMENQ